MLDGGERLDEGSWKESGGLGGVLEARLAFKGQSGLFPFLPSSAVMSPSRATLNQLLLGNPPNSVPGTTTLQELN